jgi:hypothetical protein
MPINTQTVHGIRPRAVEDPLDTYGKALSLRQMTQDAAFRDQRARAAEFELEQSRAAAERSEQFRQAIARGSKFEELAAIDPKAAHDYAKAENERSASVNANNTAKYDLLQKKNTEASQLIAAVRNFAPEQRAQAWAQVLPRLRELGATPQEAPDQIPDDTFLAVMSNKAMKVTEMLDQLRKAEEHTWKQAGEKRSQAEHEATLPGKVADAEAKQLTVAGQTAAPIANQAGWDEWRAQLPENVRKRIPAMYSPAAVQMAQRMGMTPAQQVTADQTKADSDNRTAYQKAQLAMQKRGQDMSYSAAMATGGRQVGAATAANESKLRDDYRADSKGFATVRDAYGRIVEAGKNETAAADISLLYGYMRILDPGSTVREGEFATAQNAGNIPERIRAAYNKAINGGRLTPQIRGDFLSEAEKIYNRATQDHDKMRTWYQQTATRSGMNPENVLVDYGSSVTPPQQPAGGKTPAAPASPLSNKSTDELFRMLGGINGR